MRKGLQRIDYDAIRKLDRERLDPGILSLFVKEIPPHNNRQLTSITPKRDLVAQMRSHPLARDKRVS